MTAKPHRTAIDGQRFVYLAAGHLGLVEAFEPKWWQFGRWLRWLFASPKCSVVMSGPGWSMCLRCLPVAPGQGMEKV